MIARLSTAIRRAMRRAATSKIFAVQVVLGVLTALAAIPAWWPLVVVGLVLLIIVPSPAGTGSTRLPAPGTNQPGAENQPGADRMDDLERRVDALSARLVAGTERTRVELLDALREERRTDAGGPTS
ncbi:hypothetical protein LP422_01930 [Janibacter limosus]|uniref:Uncharacterized protein n=1 Tax=Janibacter limosus TaxID=53458 RepID=A0AC61U4Z6_9MICO|nr:hypothetical protein [Janibacter limosus]UUZ45110.1 hypothetical protein LP422_01930 [Janibacter limosus]